MLNRILRIAAVLDASGDSRSTLYLRIAQGLWPKPIKIGERSAGWTEGEVSTMNDARISGASVDELRSLVAQIEAARKRPTRTAPSTTEAGGSDAR